MPRKKKQPAVVETRDLSQSFDLTRKDKDGYKAYATYLEQLLVSPGWKLLEQVLTANLTVLEQQIIGKSGAEGTPLTESQVDELRVQYAQIKQLLVRPAALIREYKKLSGAGSVPSEFNYDPYAMT